MMSDKLLNPDIMLILMCGVPTGENDSKNNALEHLFPVGGNKLEISNGTEGNTYEIKK